jgi:uncharacterized membrane protein
VSEVQPRHLGQLVAINAIWGLNIVAVKLSADRFPPVFLSFLRFLLVGLVVWPWLRVRRGEMRWLLAAATCSGGLQFAIMYSGVALSGNMSSVALASQLGVPFATLLSVALLGERIHWRRWLGIAMSFAGVAIIGFSPEVFHSWPGLLLIVVSAFIGAVGLIAVKRVREVEPLELQAWLAWGSVPILLPPRSSGNDRLGCAPLFRPAREPRGAHGLFRDDPALSRHERRTRDRTDAALQRAVLGPAPRRRPRRSHDRRRRADPDRYHRHPGAGAQGGRRTHLNSSTPSGALAR